MNDPQEIFLRRKNEASKRKEKDLPIYMIFGKEGDKNGMCRKGFKTSPITDYILIHGIVHGKLVQITVLKKFENGVNTFEVPGGETFKDWKDLLKGSRLPEGEYTFPTDGIYTTSDNKYQKKNFGIELNSDEKYDMSRCDTMSFENFNLNDIVMWRSLPGMPPIQGDKNIGNRINGKSKDEKDFIRKRDEVEKYFPNFAKDEYQYNECYNWLKNVKDKRKCYISESWRIMKLPSDFKNNMCWFKYLEQEICERNKKKHLKKNEEFSIPDYESIYEKFKELVDECSREMTMYPTFSTPEKAAEHYFKRKGKETVKSYLHRGIDIAKPENLIKTEKDEEAYFYTYLRNKSQVVICQRSIKTPWGEDHVVSVIVTLHKAKAKATKFLPTKYPFFEGDKEKVYKCL